MPLNQNLVCNYRSLLLGNIIGSLLTMKHFLLIVLLATMIGAPSLAYTGQETELVKKAILAEDSGNYREAIAIFKEVLKRNPNDFNATNSIAGLNGSLGQFAEERAWANKAIRISPNDFRGYVNLGNALAGSGKVNDAKLAFAKAASLAPKSPIPVYSQGLVAEQQGNLAESVSFYKKAIELDSRFEPAYLNLAALYANQKKFDAALEFLNKLLAVDASNKEAIAMKQQILKSHR